MMKHQCVYNIIRQVVEAQLSCLDFQIPCQAELGRDLLWFLNALGVKWIYEAA